MTYTRDLVFHPFGPDDPLGGLGVSRAVQYVRRYLADLGCKVVLEEPVYFDYDYLAEFAAFYCKSTRGYGNSCRRLHFFADSHLNRSKLEEALGELDGATENLQDSYLGFAVVRPFEPSLLGRTVLAWYPPDPTMPGRRVTTPSREYVVHLAGIRLTVQGLAWQPQDRAVGACATVALWSMLHSSAFDDHHAIPTTAAITEAAHKNASLGSRVYPSAGLTTYQLFEAIKAQRLAPNVIEGDIGSSDLRAFTPERFLATCTAFIRSGYPVLVWGMHVERDPPAERGLHAVCITGFREPRRPSLNSASHSVCFEDSDVEIVYVHDDGLGPGVRCRVSRGASNQVRLTPEAPPRRHDDGNDYPDPSVDYPHFQPISMVVAVHDDLVITSDGLHEVGLKIAYKVRDALSLVAPAAVPVVSLQTRFIGLREYMTNELRQRLGRGERLAQVRLALSEQALPMSLHLGLVRLSVDGVLLMDILFDTTDNEQYARAFANVQFDRLCEGVVPAVAFALGRDLGVAIDASVTLR